jgi:hypothetical protein
VRPVRGAGYWKNLAGGCGQGGSLGQTLVLATLSSVLCLMGSAAFHGYPISGDTKRELIPQRITL